MVNALLVIQPKQIAYSGIFDNDRKLAAVVAVSIAGHLQSTAKSESQPACQIKLGQRGEIADDVVEGDTTAADRVQVDAMWQLTRTIRFGSPLTVTVPTIARGLTSLTAPWAKLKPSGRRIADPFPMPETINRSKLTLVSISIVTSSVDVGSSRLVVGFAHKRHCAVAGGDPTTAAANPASATARYFRPPMNQPVWERA